MKNQALKLAAIATAAITFTAAETVQAATIDFNGTVGERSYISTRSSSISEDGFTLQANSRNQFIIDNNYHNSTMGFDDDYYEFNGTGANLTITADSGNAFNFVNILVGALIQNGQLEFTGYFEGGGSIMSSVGASAGQYNTFSASGFLGLSSLVISANSDGLFPSFDDIVLNEVSPIPVPGGLPIFLTGLAGFAVLRKRKKRASQT